MYLSANFGTFVGVIGIVGIVGFCIGLGFGVYLKRDSQNLR